MLTRSLPIVAGIALAAASASGQVFHSVDFNDGNTHGWLANGNTMIFEDGNPGNYLGVPLKDFFGVTLRNESNPDVIGDLTRHGGPLEFSVDVRNLGIFNFNGDPLPGEWYPLVLELVDYDGDGGIPVSVYTIVDTMPEVGDGWTRLTVQIPEAGDALPDGWGGTGAEDPDTFEPMLPGDRTYASVLQNVDEFRLTTFVPGFFYGFNFWEVGYDNVSLAVVPAPSSLALLGAAGVLAARRRRA